MRKLTPEKNWPETLDVETLLYNVIRKLSHANFSVLSCLEMIREWNWTISAFHIYLKSFYEITDVSDTFRKSDNSEGVLKLSLRYRIFFFSFY